MLWFDLVTPKSVMFFKEIIKGIQKRGKDVFITTRKSEAYSEVAELLDLYNIEYVAIGGFGGESLNGKYQASLDRQYSLFKLIARLKPEKLVCLCSVDANRLAFGLGIPIINFYDIPLSDYRSDFRKALPQARLTIPLSKLVFRPFVVPEEIFCRFSLEADQVAAYNFLDPVIWLKDFKPKKDEVKRLLKNLGAKNSKPLIVVREEEYKASYVQQKIPVLYDALPKIHEQTGANIVIIPRYESSYLVDQFPFAYVLPEKMVIQHLLAHSNLFIGGGGTINIEATYFGTPTISTRSFVSHYDQFLIEKGLMKWVDNEEELIKSACEMIHESNKLRAAAIYKQQNVNVDAIVNRILEGTLPVHGIYHEKSTDQYLHTDVQ